MKANLQILSLVLLAFLATACSQDGHITKTPKQADPGNNQAATGTTPMTDGGEVTATRVLVLVFDQYVYGVTAKGFIDMSGDFCRIEVAGLGPSTQIRIEKDAKFKLTFDKAGGDAILLDGSAGNLPQMRVTCFQRNPVSGAVEIVERADLMLERLQKITGMR